MSFPCARDKMVLTFEWNRLATKIQSSFCVWCDVVVPNLLRIVPEEFSHSSFRAIDPGGVMSAEPGRSCLHISFILPFRGGSVQQGACNL